MPCVDCLCAVLLPLQEYVNALAGCMAEMPPGVQTTPRMEQLLKEANSLIAGLVHVNPRTLREWHVLTNMESQEEGFDGPSKETLEAVVVRAGLAALPAGPGQQQGHMLFRGAANDVP